MSTRPGYKLTDIGEIPEEWKVLPIEKIAQEVKLRNNSNEDLTVFAITKHAGLVPSLQFFTKRIYSQDLTKYKVIKKGQFAYSPIHLNEGAIGLHESTDRALVSPLHVVFQMSSEADTSYFKHVFKSHRFLSIYALLPRGSIQRRGAILFRDFSRINVQLPPIKEQKKIVTILSAVDAATRNTDDVIAKSQQLKKGLMQQLLTKGIGHVKFKQTEIGEIPEDWHVASFGELCDFQNGRFFPSKEYTDNGMKLLRPGNLHEDGFLEWNHDNTRYLPLRFADTAADWIVLGNQIVMNLTAQSLEDEFIGRVCITGENERCLLNQRLARIVPRSLDSGFLFWILKSVGFRRFVDRLPGGTKIKHIYARDLRSFRLPLPPRIEQKRIATILFSAASELQSEKSQLAHLGLLKKGLMQALLSGTIRVRVT